MLSVTKTVMPDRSQVFFKCQNSGTAGSSVAAAVLGSARVNLPYQKAIDCVDRLVKSCALRSHWTC